MIRAALCVYGGGRWSRGVCLMACVDLWGARVIYARMYITCVCVCVLYLLTICE